MSTKKTEHYGLHIWEPGDDFLREEFNENFEMADAGIAQAQVVGGVYMGSGTFDPPHVIELGFRPRAVLVFPNKSAHSSLSSGRNRATLAVDGADVTGYLTITDTGFWADNALNAADKDDYSRDSYPYNPYRYLAWR